MTASFFEYLGWVSLSPNLKESFNRTLADAAKRHHPVVEIEHLLLALIDDPEGAITLNEIEVDRDQLRDELRNRLNDFPTGVVSEIEGLQPSRELKKLMAKTSDMADSERDDHIDGGDAIHALSRFETSRVAHMLKPARLKTKPAIEKSELKPEPSEEIDELLETEPALALPPLPQQKKESEAVPLNFDVDPIRASIETILERRRDAEEVLNQCEWYHLFKSLNMIEEGLEGDERKHRSKLLARAERELEERPRCRKAFMYVRHLDRELSRLKGAVNIDLDMDFEPDPAVVELDKLRSARKKGNSGQHQSSPLEELNLIDLLGEEAEIKRQLSTVRMQESEVHALEKQLERQKHSASNRESRIKELEEHLQHHDEHSRKRGNVIGELEDYLRSEMTISKERDLRILELEKELGNALNQTDSHKGRASHLEVELAAVKEHASDREKHILDLETRLKIEKDGATTHQTQIDEMQSKLEMEKSRAERHNQQVADLQKVLDEERQRAIAHEQQVAKLEADLGERLDQLKAREDQIRELQENLAAQENRVTTKEEQVKNLERDLIAHQSTVISKEEQVKKLEQELVAQQSRVITKEEQLRKLEADLAAQKNQTQSVQELERELAARQEHVTSTESELERLRLELASKQNVSEGTEAQISLLQSELIQQENESKRHEGELNALRAHMAEMEQHMRQQETQYTDEKLEMTQTIERMRQEMEETESLIEIVRAPSASGKPYEISTDISNREDALVKIISRRTMPKPKK